MQINEFIGVGENIHCTRIYKVGGKFVKQADGDSYVIEYNAGGDTRRLPVPAGFMAGADWQAGKVKHCAVAIHLGTRGSDEEQKAGIDYIRNLAAAQEAAGAAYLDINVDEFSTDVAERVELMKWTVETVQDAVAIPVSVDSSNIDILEAGLSACDKSRGRPMINSVSLERRDAVGLAASHKAVVIASAAGESDLPTTTDGRIGNLDTLMPLLRDAGLADEDIHVDPLVFPISTDGQNGPRFLEAVTAIREKYGAAIHIVAGLSNVSFGMPNRKLINQVFSHLAAGAGADGGIVDPLQINAEILRAMDTESEGYKLAKALLMGEDEFGMNYITACREGVL